MRYGWLGGSVVPYMGFCREALLDDDLDWIIMECVRSFYHQTGLKHFSNKFEVFVLDLCLTLFGILCSRRRKYIILTRRVRLTWLAAVREQGGAGCPRGSVQQPLWGCVCLRSA